MVWNFNRISRELKIVFDHAALGSRSLVDGIEGGSGGKFKLLVKNPYTRIASGDLEESSSMFRLFTASLSLSVSYPFRYCSRTAILSSVFYLPPLVPAYPFPLSSGWCRKVGRARLKCSIGDF